MNENEITLIKDLYNHYDQNQEVNDEFLKSLTENYGSIRGVLMNVILKYDPEAEISDEYLDAKLKQYNIDSKNHTLENDSIEDKVFSSEINGDTKDKPKLITSATEKTKRRWVLPFVTISSLMISLAVLYLLKSNNSVEPENTVQEIKKIDKEVSERNKLMNDENSFEDEQIFEDEKIRGLLLAEDNRNFDEVIKYYDLINIKRYWNSNYPTYDKLKSLYTSSWKSSGKSSNTIKYINKIYDKIYDVNVDFSYFDKNKNTYKSVNSTLRVVFNENGKIIENYGIDKPAMTIKHAKVTIDKAYFYKEPNYSSNQRGYLVNGDEFTYNTTVNGFVNVSFTNPSNITTNGWILKSAIKDEELPIENKKIILVGIDYQGGIVIQIDETGEHGMLISRSDLGHGNWQQAVDLCENYTSEGYYDWSLPTIEELSVIYNNQKFINNFEQNWYWSSTEDSENHAFHLGFISGDQMSVPKVDGKFIRAIRKF